jgi:hypothetical protein
MGSERWQPRIEHEDYDFQSHMNVLRRAQDNICNSDLSDEARQLALDAICVEANEQLSAQGYMGSGAIIHSGAKAFLEQDRPAETLEYTVMGGYKGVTVLEGGIVHMIDYHGATIDEDDPGRYAYYHIDIDVFDIMTSASTPMPEIQDLDEFREAIRVVPSSDYSQLWSDVNRIAVEAKDHRITNWFLEELENQAGMYGEEIVCQSDEVRYNHVGKDGTMAPGVKFGASEVRGSFICFGTVPRMISRIVNGRKATLIDTDPSNNLLSVTLWDGERILNVPLKNYSKMTQVTKSPDPGR